MALLQTFGAPSWKQNLEAYLKTRQGLAARYAKQREMNKLSVTLGNGATLRLSPGAHNDLIKAIIEEFASRFAPGSTLLYVGDTGDKWAHFDKVKLSELGVELDGHGKMPDVVLYYAEREWLLLIESVTSHGPVNSKRHDELTRLFAKSKAGLVYVTAFPSRSIMAGYLSEISWETEVWCADAPTHMIHFNGERFLGPYQ